MLINLEAYVLSLQKAMFLDFYMFQGCKRTVSPSSLLGIQNREQKLDVESLEDEVQCWKAQYLLVSDK